MAGDASIVGLTAVIRNQGRVFIVTQDFSTTIAAGARSTLINITGILYNSICIVGVAYISEANTDWRIKFYKRDTGIVTTYATDTYIGDIEIKSPSATASTYYEGSAEANLYYWDADQTNEIHVIAENIGNTNTSKLFLNILYTGAD